MIATTKPPSPLPKWFYPLMRYSQLGGLRPAAPSQPKDGWFMAEKTKFEKWNYWRDHPETKRPTGIWKVVPQWAWLLRKEVLKRKPLPAPLPPSKAKPPASWSDNQAVMFTAWEPALARSGPWRTARIIVPGIAPIWQVSEIGYIAQTETVNQRAGALDYLKQVSGQKAVVATQEGWENPQPFLDAGINTCFVEAYGPEGWPYSDTARMLWQAEHDGWPHVIPVFGVYHNYPLAAYNLDPYGKRISAWLAEEFQEKDWATWASKVS